MKENIKSATACYEINKDIFYNDFKKKVKKRKLKIKEKKGYGFIIFQVDGLIENVELDDFLRYLTR